MGIACQLASIVVFIIVLLLTGVANVALVPQAERVGKGGDSPERSKEKSGSQEEQREIEEDEYREQRLPNTRIRKTAKTEKSAASLASSGNVAKETPPKPQSTRKRTKRRARRSETKSKAKQSDLAIDETTSSASKPSAERETTETTEEITTIESMPVTQAEQPDETTNSPPPPPRQWEKLEDHLLAVQCPMPGQQGAPCFGGREITEFLRNWKRMANKYRSSTATKIESVVDYCTPEMGNSVKALMSMARREVRDETQATREESQWRVCKERALEQYRNADSVQMILTVDYLKALAADRDIRKDEGEVEYYINEFDDVAAELVKMRRLTWYDRMVLFLEGLAVKIARKVYEDVKLDTKKLETFERSGVFNEVVEAALNHNRADADFNRLGLRANQEAAKEMISAILRRPKWKPPTPANAEGTPPTQAPPTRPNASEDVIVGLLEEMWDLRIYVQQGWAEQAGRSPNQIARKAPFAVVAAGPMTGMRASTCFWCGNEGHIKTRCPDYQNSLANRMIHLQGTDPRTRLGPQGYGGPIVPLQKESGLWQQVWVERERRKPESAMQQHGRIEEAREVSIGPETTPAGKLRQLRLEETRTHPQTRFVGALTVGPPQLNLCPGEVRAYVAQESEDGVIQAWVVAKRTAEDMEDSITVVARDAMRKRQAREVSYPQAGGRSETPEDEEMIVEVTPDLAGTAQNSPELQDDADDSESEEEQPQPKKTRKTRKTGVQQGWKVPIKLRAEAQPERMVDKILDQVIDKITVRELWVCRQICCARSGGFGVCHH